jgi:hypothetical protein
MLETGKLPAVNFANRWWCCHPADAAHDAVLGMDGVSSDRISGARTTPKPHVIALSPILTRQGLDGGFHGLRTRHGWHQRHHTTLVVLGD